MIEEKGTLPIGVAYDGVVWREFILRPLKMRDSVEARASEDAARLTANDECMGLYLLGRRLTIVGVPRAAMTLDFMLEMWDDDMSELLAADGRLANAMTRFRGRSADGTKAGSDADEDGVLLPGGDGDGGIRGSGLAGCLGGNQEPSGRQGEEVQGPESPSARP